MSVRILQNVRGFLSDYFFVAVLVKGGNRRRKQSDRDSDFALKRFLRTRERAEGRCESAADCRERWARPLLRDVLGFHLGAADDDGIHGLFASADDETAGQKPLLLAWCGAWDEDPFAGKGKSRPVGRIEAALGRRDVRYGLLVTGERLSLIRAAGEGPREARLEWDLDATDEEPDFDTFAVAWRLFRVDGFRPDASGTVPIDEVERESRKQAERVSDDLEGAVFRAAESLAQGLVDDAAARAPDSPLAQMSEDDVLAFRDAALLCLYRLLFVLYAEARDPRLDGHTVYRDSYSAQGLLDQVLREPERAWPSNRTTLWSRVLALFRIYDKGLPKFHEYEHIPPRGGTFFSETTPAGAILANARLGDAVVAVVIRDLGTTAPRAGVGRERVSFRELDIENLGAVYEGLLDHEPQIAIEPSFELTVGGRKYALSAEEVQRLCRVKSLRLRADDALVAGTPLAALARGEVPDDEAAESEDPEDAEADDDAPDDEEDEPEAVKKGAVAKMVRRIEAGRFHFVPGAARKGSGSFYTPRPLVHDLVRHALDPVIEGRTPVEIESLRILDPACGSGHFLVEAMRHMARALHRAYVETYDGKAPPEFRATLGEGWDTNWRASDEDARAANSEARAWCKRRIAERCLFGVDLNRTAVELARVALWIESLAGDRPLSYFEHHVRWGNSLVGTWIDALGRPPIPPKSAKDVAPTFGLMTLRKAIDQAAELRLLIEVPDPDALRREAIEPESVDEWGYKERLRTKAHDLLDGIGLLFDCRSASLFVPEIWRDWEALQALALRPGELRASARKRPWWDQFETVCRREHFFHWEVEFPEVLLDEERPGFDAVLGNPPWDKVLPTKHEFYAREDLLIRAFKGNDLDARVRELHAAHPGLADAFKAYQARAKAIAEFLRKSGDFPHSRARTGAAHEDVAKYFLDRAIRLVARGGAVGFVVPSVVYNGDGCVGIRQFLLTGGTIERFYGFENRSKPKVFPIDSRMKFVSLVFRSGEAASGFDAAFMRHDLSELLLETRPRWMVHVSRSELARLSPETWAFLEYREPRDQEIVHRMHDGLPTLGGREAGSWGTELMSWRDHSAIFNASEDKDLFTDPTSHRLHSPMSVLGEEPASVGETIEKMRARGYWPVLEGKHVEQYVVGIKAVRWWLSLAQAKEKYGKLPREQATLVFRETAANTNERTCIASVMPPHSCGSHKLTGVITSSIDSRAACAVLNSLAFDFALRKRTAGTSVSFTYIEPMPVPDSATVAGLPAVGTQLAWIDGRTHVEQKPDLWTTLWASNRAVAEAYGLDASDFEHILASFPGFARKRPKLVAYFRERLAEWQAEDVRSGVASRQPWPAVPDGVGQAAEPAPPDAPDRPPPGG